MDAIAEPNAGGCVNRLALECGVDVVSNEPRGSDRGIDLTAAPLCSSKGTLDTTNARLTSPRFSTPCRDCIYHT